MPALEIPKILWGKSPASSSCQRLLQYTDTSSFILFLPLNRDSFTMEVLMQWLTSPIVTHDSARRFVDKMILTNHLEPAKVEALLEGKRFFSTVKQKSVLTTSHSWILSMIKWEILSREMGGESVDGSRPCWLRTNQQSQKHPHYTIDNVAAWFFGHALVY